MIKLIAQLTNATPTKGRASGHQKKDFLNTHKACSQTNNKATTKNALSTKIASNLPPWQQGLPAEKQEKNAKKQKGITGFSQPN